MVTEICIYCTPSIWLSARNKLFYSNIELNSIITKQKKRICICLHFANKIRMDFLLQKLVWTTAAAWYWTLIRSFEMWLIFIDPFFYFYFQTTKQNSKNYKEKSFNLCNLVNVLKRNPFHQNDNFRWVKVFIWNMVYSLWLHAIKANML